MEVSLDNQSVLRQPVQQPYPLEVSSGAKTSVQEPKQSMLLKNSPPPPMASVNRPLRTLAIKAQEGIKKCLLKESLLSTSKLTHCNEQCFQLLLNYSSCILYSFLLTRFTGQHGGMLYIVNHLMFNY